MVVCSSCCWFTAAGVAVVAPDAATYCSALLLSVTAVGAVVAVALLPTLMLPCSFTVALLLMPLVYWCTAAGAAGGLLQRPVRNVFVRHGEAKTEVEAQGENRQRLDRRP